jgi:MmeI, target recognition domain
MRMVCVRLGMRFFYSNTLGWNTFPVPTVTEKNKANFSTCRRSASRTPPDVEPSAAGGRFQPPRSKNFREASITPAPVAIDVSTAPLFIFKIVFLATRFSHRGAQEMSVAISGRVGLPGQPADGAVRHIE